MAWSSSIIPKFCSRGLLGRSFGAVRLASSTSPQLAEASLSENSDVHLRWSDGKSCPVSSFWLRDYCLCGRCRHPRSYHRDLLTFQLNSQETKLTAADLNGDEDGELTLTWADGHQSKYPSSWLRMHCMGNSSPDGEHHLTAVEQIRQQSWSAEQIKANLTEVSHEEFETKEGLRKILFGLRLHGLTLIHGVPCNTSGTRSVGERLGGIDRTLYEDMWDTKPSVSEHPDDQAYSRASLSLHTDCAFSEIVPAIQVFHCYVAAEGDGTSPDLCGASVFTDGLHVAKQLAAKHPESFEYLCLTPLLYHFHYEDAHVQRLVHRTGTHPVFRYNEFGDLQQVTYNNHHRAPQNCSTATEMYKHLKVVNEAFHAKENAFQVLLRPGTVALVDNYRVLHGRTAFRGQRHLAGCYVGLDQLYARFREFLFPEDQEKLY